MKGVRGYNLFDDNYRGKSALKTWQREMQRRKYLMNFLSRHLNRGRNNMLMNVEDNCYDFIAECNLIDQTMPLVSYGKGNRFRSEFWFQYEALRKRDSRDIYISRTLKDKGFYPVIEHIVCPTYIKQEKGIIDSFQLEDDNIKYFRDIKIKQRLSHDSYINEQFSTYTTELKLKKQTYKMEKFDELRTLIREIEPHTPNLDEIVIVGKKISFPTERAIKKEASKTEASNIDIDFERTMPIDNNTSNDKSHEMVASHNGPSLQINGESFNWIQKLQPHVSPRINEIEICFNCEDERPYHKKLDLYNDGTTLIYYSWKLIEKQNYFQVPTRDEQIFFFNMGNGIIPPGVYQKLNFSYQSSNEGRFTESWILQTEPQLLPEENIHVHLCGISIWPDSHPAHAWKLCHPEKIIEARAIERYIRYLVYQIIDNIKSPDRPQTPLSFYENTQDKFEQVNREVYYKADYVAALEQLKIKIMEESISDDIENYLSFQLTESVNAGKVSNISLSSIRELIGIHLSKNNIDLIRAESYYQQLNEIVTRISFRSILANRTTFIEYYQIGYRRLSVFFEESFSFCSDLRLACGLSELSTKIKASSNMCKDRNQNYLNNIMEDISQINQIHGGEIEDSLLLNECENILISSVVELVENPIQKLEMEMSWKEKAQCYIRCELINTFLDIFGLYEDFSIFY